ncbi:MAG: TerC family protein [Neomegalonema sp.]|nr:TerC family protein [Neomegalonema sp.]
MMELFADPAVWVSLLTLTILEIVLGIDNIIFISIIAGKLPAAQRARARYIGLAGALVLRLLLLASIAWIAQLTTPVITLFGTAFSWRDIILLLGGLFLLYKATSEIHSEVEGEQHETGVDPTATFAGVITQIMILDMVFSLDSVITAVGIADHLPVMVAAVVIAMAVMMVGAGPISSFIERHPTTKMLALAFLVMVGMALIADGFHVHIERGFIYGAMAFSAFVEVLNLLRQSARKKRRARSR